MLRQWSTWAVLTLLSASAIAYSFAYFGEAFPIVSVDLRMSRAAALDSARAQAERLGLGPEGFSQAAAFDADRRVQSYAELEGGGREAYQRMIETGRYQPYQWRVRHYASDSARETVFSYAPDGTPYGFREDWPESAPGPALPADSARQIAEARATAVWNVDLSSHDLVSSSRNELPSGRIDHTFLYQRPEEILGDEGRYRLRLRVSGDELSMVKRFVKVPQGFQRRYENMRSANGSIAQAGNIAMGLLYGLGGLLGLVWLFRQGAVKWRMAAIWGGGIAGLLFLTRLNRLPLAWMNYDTAIGPRPFLLDQVVSAFTSAAGWGIAITLTFVVAEGLSRMAFGNHPRLWKVWRPEAASSVPILSRTVLGYVLVGMLFAYDVALYLYAQDLLGWWNPSSLLFQPNVLAHVAPWLSPIVTSLRAGFWEECLFRAIPLAGAALIGDRLGGRKWWIGGAMLLQALIFGAVHANHPAQPAYARLVELILPSILWGGLYLSLGLLPGIVLHFAVDVVWFAQPLFASEAPGIWASQTAVILLTAVPLVAVFYGRLRSGGFAAELPERFYNRSWAPPTDTESSGHTLPVTDGLSRRAAVGCALAGLLGAGFWIGGTSFTTYETKLSASRAEAEQVAREELTKVGGDPKSWMIASEAETLKGQEDRFVWREGGPSAYRQLMGSYLDAPFWKVRLFTFADSTSVEDRAEEHVVHWGPGWDLREIVHRRPRDAPGDSLTGPEARALADSALQARLDLNPDRLKRIKASPKPRPNRRDWTFVYADTTRYPLDEGQARIKVVLTGGEVKDLSRSVHVPEFWTRKTRGERKAVGTLKSTMEALMAGISVAGLLLLLVWWARGPFRTRAFAGMSTFLFVIGVLGVANRWPDVLADLSTAQPYLNQVAFDMAGPLLGITFTSVAAGLGAGVLHARVGGSRPTPLWRSIAGGVGLGLFGKGALALTRLAGPGLFPPWSSYDSLSKTIPWYDAISGRVGPFVLVTLILLLGALTAHRWTGAGRARRWHVAGGTLLGGFAVAGTANPNTIVVWGLYGAVTAGLLGVGYLMVVRHDRATIPMIGATVIGLDAVEAMAQAAYPGALIGEALALGIILSLGIGWSYLLRQRQAEQATGQADRLGSTDGTTPAE
jgi:hypothetical protein